jgi:hypothetical protein
VTYWAVLFGLSGRAEERPLPGRPAPAFGAYALDWTPDVRERYFAELPALERATVDAMDPAERIRLHRRLTIRSALRSEFRRSHRFLEPVRPLFDEGVALARRIGTPVDGARALFDRSSALTAAHGYAEAYADFREARTHRDAVLRHTS